ncbi:hypothetical protein DE146DRAFT_767393 [Phaeosphaeria sp. MPI-PUGE-AT-0046c]|nr:hypothetical protein DE146DRAFT_767393 [Phaeosphaeria sp. MPI-PUGE-AT-0046c]
MVLWEPPAHRGRRFSSTAINLAPLSLSAATATNFADHWPESGMASTDFVPTHAAGFWKVPTHRNRRRAPVHGLPPLPLLRCPSLPSPPLPSPPPCPRNVREASAPAAVHAASAIPPPPGPVAGPHAAVHRREGAVACFAVTLLTAASLSVSGVHAPAAQDLSCGISGAACCMADDAFLPSLPMDYPKSSRTARPFSPPANQSSWLVPLTQACKLPQHTTATPLQCCTLRAATRHGMCYCSIAPCQPAAVRILPGTCAIGTLMRQRVVALRETCLWRACRDERE